MRDLEIRGAGSLLGEIQSGHLEQVGYDTYCKLLDEVVKEMQGEKVKPEIDVQIDLDRHVIFQMNIYQIQVKKSKYIKILLYVRMRKIYKM